MKASVLAEGDVAIISTNRHCGCVNVIFHNLSITLSESGFGGFRSQIDELIQQHTNGLFDKQFFHVETPYQGVTLYFRPEEITELQSLMHKAKIVLDIRKVTFDSTPSLN